jgi:hypothetical protein
VGRFVIATRRRARSGSGKVPSALDVVSSEPGVTVVSSADPFMITIETSDEVADQLRRKWGSTQFVEPEVRREKQLRNL